MNRRLLTIFLMMSGWLSISLVHAHEHTHDKLDQVISAVKDKKAVLIDVREKSEWDKGHLKDAKLLPLSKLKKEIVPEEVQKIIPRKETIVYLHCASGYRCLEAAPLLRKLGYEVRALSAGYKDLLKAGLPPAPAEPKPAEPKPAEPKPAESEPVESKSAAAAP